MSQLEGEKFHEPNASEMSLGISTSVYVLTTPHEVQHTEVVDNTQLSICADFLGKY